MHTCTLHFFSKQLTVATPGGYDRMLSVPYVTASRTTSVARINEEADCTQSNKRVVSVSLDEWTIIYKRLREIIAIHCGRFTSGMPCAH